MAAQVLDGEVVRHWLRLAVGVLGQARSAIDELNVFPVPDSDTGTNLHATMSSAAHAVAVLPAGAAQAQVWRAAATAAMRGACGNSGIICSELLRGLAEVCGPASPCDGRVLARALANAAMLARAAVHRPAEGTVLTVADAAALAALDAAGDLADVAMRAAAASRLALAGTSAQLDVLAASGVVDAGGAGLCVLLDALCVAVGGTPPGGFAVPGRIPGRGLAVGGPGQPAAAEPIAAARQPAAHAYEVTFLFQAALPQLRQLREQLDLLGDSLVVCGGEPEWHVHVHVADPGAAIEAGLQAGRPSRITVTCLHGTVVHAAGGPPAPRTGHHVVAAVDGPGLASLLRRAGAFVATESGAAGHGETPALPSGPAIILGGNQPSVLTVGHRADLVPAPGAASVQPGAGSGDGCQPPQWLTVQIASPVQALAALAVHDPRRDITHDAAAMRRAVAGMRYAAVTTGLQAGPDIVGSVGDEIVAAGTDQAAVARSVIDRLLADGAELVTLVGGASAEPGLTDLAAAHACRRLPEAEITCYDGGMASAILLIGAE